jgi:hypothetical protein
MRLHHWATIGELDNLSLLVRRQLIVGERNRVDAAGDVVQRTLSIAGGVAPLLNGDRSQDDLEAVSNAMLHFTKEHVPAAAASLAASFNSPRDCCPVTHEGRAQAIIRRATV